MLRRAEPSSVFLVSGTCFFSALGVYIHIIDVHICMFIYVIYFRVMVKDEGFVVIPSGMMMSI